MRKPLARLTMTSLLVAGAMAAAGIATGESAGPDAGVLATPVGFGAAATGGAGGQTVTVSTADAFTSAVQSGSPMVVQVDGTIALSGMTRVAADKTIEGVGASGRLTGGGLQIREVDNVIVRNLAISGSGDDNISVDASTNVWIDHTDLSGANDGSLDIKHGADLVTVSWNRFHDQDKNALLGHSDDNAAEDTGHLRVTYHHNWFDGTNQRNPRVRFGNPVHVFNNYYSDIGSYGVASTTNAGVLVESNYFENVADPFHLGEGSSGPGSLVARDNHLVNSGSGQTGGNVATIPYSYSVDPAASVKSIVTGGAGVGQPAAATQPLRDHASARGLLIGAAVATGPLSGEPAYQDTLNREFNAVTAENAMKWDATEPNPGQFTFAGADQVVSSAEANGQTVHGHTLVWHNQTPGWVQNLDAAGMRAAMQNHISTVVGRYAGRVASWDVVNEVFDDNGGMRQSFWYQRLGESFIADAFRYARAADPNAKLCINDYNVEGVNAKSTAMYNLVSRLRGQRVPIDCVGIQGHLAIQYGFPNDLRQNIQRFADLGVDVRITELDVRMQLPADATKLATQATYYRGVADACLAVSRCVALTVWGFTDKHSWVPGTFPGEGAALPYNENYAPKPAYQSLHDALGG
jgi:GH35 family endo-1,4-beta-xylanase/pectate lyase